MLTAALKEAPTADSFFEDRNIVPLIVTMDHVPSDLAELYRRWLQLSQQQPPHKSNKPWIPVGSLGPILLLAHYNVDTPLTLPEWISGRCFIAEESYTRLLSDLKAQSKVAEQIEYSPQANIPFEKPNWEEPIDALAFLADLGVLSPTEKAATDQFSKDVTLLPHGLREAVMFLLKTCPIIDLRYNRPLEELVGLTPETSVKHDCLCFYKTDDFDYVASGKHPSDTIRFNIEDLYRAEVNAERTNLRFVLANREVLSEIVRSKRASAASPIRTDHKVPEREETYIGDTMLQLSNTDIRKIDPERNGTTEIDIVRWVLGQGVLQGASNIHIDMLGAHGRVRFEIEGLMHVIPQVRLPLDRHRVFVGALKDEARMTRPQASSESSRIGLLMDDMPVDIRVEGTQTRDGRLPQFFCLRLLGNSRSRLRLTDLQMGTASLSDMRAFLRRPKGLLLVTGPTNSGKTTTINCALRELNTPDVKICTAEDPVEQIIEGINQVQVKPGDPEKGWVAVLRSFLRQAPDIIGIGEIRDQATAEIAVEAASTGHLVIASLHTNTAASAVDRLVSSWGIDRHILADNIIGVHAQHMLHTLCPSCKLEREITDDERKVFIANDVEVGSVIRVVNPLRKPCPICHGKGYNGRVAVMETIRNNADFYTAIRANVGVRELSKIARQGGTVSMLRDALMRVAAGTVDIEEALQARDIYEM